MMNSQRAPTLPLFRYHPDPIRSGSLIESQARCRCCGSERGFIYTGPVYTEAELSDALCPWCIADGSAHEKFEATFVDSEAFAADAPATAIAEITERTPGFSAWQQEKWPSCCGEPAAFLTPAGLREIREQYPRLEGNLMMLIVHELDISGDAARQTFEGLQRHQSPTAFVFKCLHCDGFPVYLDSV
jgi:uncharacterized protein CbrC (UPF0167 family)